MKGIFTVGAVVSLALGAACGAPDVPGTGDGSVGPPAEFALNGSAKRFCSAIWVSERDRSDALYQSILLTEDEVTDYEEGRLVFEVDEERRIVAASRGAAKGRARHFGDQGCVILPPHTDNVFFTPRAVTSALPDAGTTPWPMGDLLPDDPFPAAVDMEKVAQAVAAAFDPPEALTAAFVVTFPAARPVAGRRAAMAVAGVLLIAHETLPVC